MSITSNNAPPFGKKFLEDIDEYISRQYLALTCDDIGKIYFQFFEDMKFFKGNSNGFTGLSEYLIFRLLYHLLGGDFKAEPISESHWSLYNFTSKSNRDLQLSQSTCVDKKVTGRGRIYPDIGVWYGKKLIAVCQIKIYLTNGVKEVRDELDKLDCLKKAYSDLQALLLVFNEISGKGKVVKLLKEEVTKKPWFRYCSLKGNSQLLNNVLKEGLNLDRIPIAKKDYV